MGTWGTYFMLPKGGISCRTCQPDVSLSVNADNPGFGGLPGASPLWAVPGTENLLALLRTGPDLPPPWSLSHFSSPAPPGHLSLLPTYRVLGFRKGGDRLKRDRMSPSVILFLWFSFQAVTVNLFYLSLCKSLCRIKPFTSF